MILLLLLMEELMKPHVLVTPFLLTTRMKGVFLTNANLVNEDWSIKLCLIIEFIREE